MYYKIDKQENMKEIFNAIREYNIEYVRKNVNKTNINKIYCGKTLLIEAVMVGDYDIVKLLLEKGADVNKRNWRNDAPIVAACIRKDKKIVELLLSYKCNVKYSTGAKALYYTLKNKIYGIKYYVFEPDWTVKIGKRLIEAGANPFLYNGESTYIKMLKHYNKKDRQILYDMIIKKYNTLLRLTVHFINSNRHKFKKMDMKMLNKDIRKNFNLNLF